MSGATLEGNESKQAKDTRGRINKTWTNRQKSGSKRAA